MATSTPESSEFAEIHKKEEMSPEKESSELGVVRQLPDFEEGDNNGIQQPIELDRGDCDDIQQPQMGCAEIQETEENSPEKERLRHVECENKKLEQEVEQVKSDLKKKEEELKSLQEEYNMVLTNPSTALKKKDEELKSFKKRMAASMAVSLKAGGMESLNNPVSKTRLTEMYDNLKLLQWPKVKDQLKSKNNNPNDTKGLIQEICNVAFDKMKDKKQQIEEAFGLTSSSNELATQKVKEYKLLAVQNLQMALFHINKEELVKSGFSEHGGQYSEEMEVDLRPLTSECYWLSCLMALNDPPLQPDWKNHVPSMDPWDIFPRNII